jgi:hypothetical protein
VSLEGVGRGRRRLEPPLFSMAGFGGGAGAAKGGLEFLALDDPGNRDKKSLLLKTKDLHSGGEKCRSKLGSGAFSTA